MRIANGSKDGAAERITAVGTGEGDACCGLWGRELGKRYDVGRVEVLMKLGRLDHGNSCSVKASAGVGG